MTEASDAMAQLAVGTVFASLEDAMARISNYNEENFTNFVITSNNKKSLVYTCRNGVERKSKCGGIRPNQHYNFVGCKATIRIYKLTDGTLRVSQLNLDHINHIVSETVHRFDNDS